MKKGKGLVPPLPNKYGEKKIFEGINISASKTYIRNIVSHRLLLEHFAELQIPEGYTGFGTPPPQTAEPPPVNQPKEPIVEV